MTYNTKKSILQYNNSCTPTQSIDKYQQISCGWKAAIDLMHASDAAVVIRPGRQARGGTEWGVVSHALIFIIRLIVTSRLWCRLRRLRPIIQIDSWNTSWRIHSPATWLSLQLWHCFSLLQSTQLLVAPPADKKLFLDSMHSSAQLLYWSPALHLKYPMESNFFLFPATENLRNRLSDSHFLTIQKQSVGQRTLNSSHLQKKRTPPRHPLRESGPGEWRKKHIRCQLQNATKAAPACEERSTQWRGRKPVQGTSARVLSTNKGEPLARPPSVFTRAPVGYVQFQLVCGPRFKLRLYESVATVSEQFGTSLCNSVQWMQVRSEF